VAASGQAAPTPNPYCGWCARKLTCPAFNERVLEIARNREDWKLDHYHSSEITDPREMSKALDLAPLVEKWAESVRFHAREMAIKQGRSIPGYEVATRSVRSIPDIAMAYKLAQIPPDMFLQCCKITLGELEKAYAQGRNISIAKAKTLMNEILAPVIVTSQTQLLKKV
jgi:hypothetical protein